jgi:hypothetical protein
MNATLAPGASLRRIAEIVRHAVLLGPDAWAGGSASGKNVNPNSRPNLLPTDRDMIELFTLLRARGIADLLVGGIAMLRYVAGRNTEDVDLLMSLPSVKQLPEIIIEEQSEYFIRGRFRTVRVDVLLTANAVFAEVQQNHAAIHRFAELDVPTATPEGLILLKLYALPSLYHQGLFDRISVYEPTSPVSSNATSARWSRCCSASNPTWKRATCMSCVKSCATFRPALPGLSSSKKP